MMRKRLKVLAEAYFNFTLRNKFIIPIIIVMFMSFLIFSIYLLRDQRTEHEARLQAKAERITYLLLSSNLESIWDVDRETLEQNCLAFFEDQELTRLVITDTFYGDDVLINLSKKTIGTQDIVKTANFIRRDKKIAELEVVFTNYYIEQHLAQMRNTLMTLSILVFFLMIVLISVVSQIALMPLKGLMDGVQHLTAGDLTFRIPLESQDELGKLAVSFNTMAHELNLYHDHLQELVEQRTTELTTVNAQLHQEIDERKRAEDALRASESELRALFAGMTDVVIMVNRAGHYLKIAPTSPELLYKPANELFGTTLHETFSQDQADIFLEHIHQSLDTQQLVKLEYRLNIGGTDLWFDGRFAPMSPDTVVFVARDITERKQMEDDLRQAKDTAEAASRAKSVFLANMSHELRTPLNAVLGYAQILSRSRNLPPDEKEHVDTIMRSGEHLLALINDVLELSRIDANRIELRPVCFDLHQMLSDLKAMFQLRAERKGLTLTFEYTSDVPSYIRADQNKLRQIMINLLGNAVKYTEEGRVELEVTKVTKVTKVKEFPSWEGLGVGSQSSIVNLQFSISDTGIGIAPANLESIFDAFVRVDEQQYNKGTGLGLPISQKYVRMMGGDIHMESDVGKGSTFSFEIPVELVDQSTIDNRQSTISKRVIGLEPGQPDYRILIVENEEDNRNLLVHILKPMGLQVREAVNGEEAIALWRTWQPHLIWMDMRMPVMDGYEATKEIRKLEIRNSKLETSDSQFPVSSFQFQTKIIALTASAFEEDRTKVLEAGCDDFVRKPFQEAEIFDMLHQHLGVRFIYEEEKQSTINNQQSTIEKVLTPEALAALPAEWLATLEHGAKETNTKLLFEVIEQIRQHDAAVADALARLTDDFAYDTILTILHQAKEQVME